MKRRDRGSFSIEAVVALPVLMLTILAATQAALLFFAHSVALAAAQEGVRAGRAEHGSPGAAAAVAQRYAESTANGILASISATSSDDGITVRVRIHAKALSLVPFLPSMPVVEENSGAVERFTTPADPGAGR